MSTSINQTLPYLTLRYRYCHYFYLILFILLLLLESIFRNIWFQKQLLGKCFQSNRRPSLPTTLNDKRQTSQWHTPTLFSAISRPILSSAHFRCCQHTTHSNAIFKNGPMKQPIGKCYVTARNYRDYFETISLNFD